MSTLKFKTNMKCNGCVESVTPFLNALTGIKTWKADITNPDKILEVDAETVCESEIIEAVNKAGFSIIKIN